MENLFTEYVETSTYVFSQDTVLLNNWHNKLDSFINTPTPLSFQTESPNPPLSKLVPKTTTELQSTWKIVSV